MALLPEFVLLVQQRVARQRVQRLAVQPILAQPVLHHLRQRTAGLRVGHGPFAWRSFITAAEEARQRQRSVHSAPTPAALPPCSSLTLVRPGARAPHLEWLAVRALKPEGCLPLLGVCLAADALKLGGRHLLAVVHDALRQRRAAQRSAVGCFGWLRPGHRVQGGIKHAVATNHRCTTSHDCNACNHKAIQEHQQEEFSSLPLSCNRHARVQGHLCAEDELCAPAGAAHGQYLRHAFRQLQQVHLHPTKSSEAGSVMPKQAARHACCRTPMHVADAAQHRGRHACG